MTDLDSVITLIVITLMVLTLINFPEGLKRKPICSDGFRASPPLFSGLKSDLSDDWNRLETIILPAASN